MGRPFERKISDAGAAYLRHQHTAGRYSVHRRFVRLLAANALSFAAQQPEVAGLQ